MRTLVNIEIRRMMSRRLLRFLVGLALLGILAAGVIVFVVSHHNDPGDLARAQVVREQQMEQCLAGEIGPSEQECPECFVDHAQFCANEVVPQVKDSRFHLTAVSEVSMGLSVPALILAWLLGASAVGAEWHNRTVTTTLTWEPRRTRVLAAKAVGASIVMFVLTVTLLAVLAAALYPAAAIRGTTMGVDAAWWGEFAEIVMRAGALSAVAAAMGLAIATIGRNTAAAVGAGFVYIAIVESLVRGYKPAWTRWLIGDNAATFVFGPNEVGLIGRGRGGAVLLLGMYALILLAAASIVFARRDVN
ncbi:MAG: ABC transporter permease subunit [Actinomycetota bacterium]